MHDSDDITDITEFVEKGVYVHGKASDFELVDGETDYHDDTLIRGLLST